MSDLFESNYGRRLEVSLSEDEVCLGWGGGDSLLSPETAEALARSLIKFAAEARKWGQS